MKRKFQAVRTIPDLLIRIYVLHISISLDANKLAYTHSKRQDARAPKVFIMALIILFSLVQHPSQMTGKIISSFLS
jgi:hypothetical protein